MLQCSIVALAGSIWRDLGKVPMLTGYGERPARMVTSALVDKGLLTAATHRAALRLAFPPEVVERWFPQLYPASL